MVSEQIKISKLHANKGQIPGLPANPRSWTKEELNKIAQSLRETPELFGMRPIIVYPIEDGYVVLGGNLRLAGAKKNKDREVPCIIVPEDTPVEKLKEIVIKDNGSFGEWDFDALANEWDDLPLTDWGVPAWDTEEKETKEEAQDDGFDEDAQAIEVRCKRGDVWQLGDHRLMCGDSIDLEDVKRLMGGGRNRPSAD